MVKPKPTADRQQNSAWSHVSHAQKRHHLLGEATEIRTHKQKVFQTHERALHVDGRPFLGSPAAIRRCRAGPQGLRGSFKKSKAKHECNSCFNVAKLVSLKESHLPSNSGGTFQFLPLDCQVRLTLMSLLQLTHLRIHFFLQNAENTSEPTKRRHTMLLHTILLLESF